MVTSLPSCLWVTVILPSLVNVTTESTGGPPSNVLPITQLPTSLVLLSSFSSSSRAGGPWTRRPVTARGGAFIEVLLSLWCRDPHSGHRVGIRVCLAASRARAPGGSLLPFEFHGLIPT